MRYSLLNNSFNYKETQNLHVFINITYLLEWATLLKWAPDLRYIFLQELYL